MHALIEEGLEEHLDGSLHGVSKQKFDAHLASCRECVDELRLMQQHAQLLQMLKAPGDAEPRPGFYARVLDSIEKRRPASFWDLFLLPSFNFQLTTASVLLLLLGSYLFTASMQQPAANSPARFIAAHERFDDHLGQDTAYDRDVVLVNLVPYSD